MQHGGNIYAFAQQIGCLPEQVIDFSANINPSQAVAVQDLSAVSLTPYGDPDYGLLKQAIKNRYPLPDEADIEVFNGASAAIFSLLRFLQPAEVVLYAPLYGEYQRLSERLGCKVQLINRFVGDVTEHRVPPGCTVIFVNPATPDGTLYDLTALLGVWQAADCHIVVDESFLDFCQATSTMACITDYKKLYVVKSLSKFYGCAGVRVGFLTARSDFIRQLKTLEPAWKLSSLDMAYMQSALANIAFVGQTLYETQENRILLRQVLENTGQFATVYPSAANFILARLPDEGDGYDMQAKLAPFRLLIRVCDNFIGLDKRYIRFAVKDKKAIKQLAQGLENS
ncbi:MAG: aminotransferase class I/II-fold pyridoxal phosphate-dependent enzyme [Methylococcaceae bacterium]|nr:aminotransferase class I/II-fold pyridoxal phosphate-dependent enzyme [Methylococcaceae bacterium]